MTKTRIAERITNLEQRHGSSGLRIFQQQRDNRALFRELQTPDDRFFTAAQIDDIISCGQWHVIRVIYGN